MNTESLMYVDLPDGRRLEVRAAGPQDGEILLFHPGSGSLNPFTASSKVTSAGQAACARQLTHTACQRICG